VPASSTSASECDTKPRRGTASSGSILKDGIIAKSIEKRFRGGPAWLLPGDQLIGISLDGEAAPNRLLPRATFRFISSRLAFGGTCTTDEAAVVLAEVGAYWADLDNLGAIHKWTPRVLYINLIGVVFLCVGFFVLFKQGGRAPYALHFATFCLAALFFFSTRRSVVIVISIWRSRFSTTRR
jgi:hypothetical protein